MNKKACLEGLLFIAGEDGFTSSELQKLLEVNELELKELLNKLYRDYQQEDRGIDIAFLGYHYKLITKKEHQEVYKKLAKKEENSTLSEAALETLAIIAYNEPITRIKVDEIRGVSSVHHLRKLLLKDLIKEIGKSDLPGRPLLYGTTQRFLDYFGLSSKEELPKIIENKIPENEDIDLFTSRYKEEQ